MLQPTALRMSESSRVCDMHMHMHSQVLRASQDQFEKANDSLIARIKELEFKLVTRESRPEDLERIAQLEKEVAEKVLQLATPRPAKDLSPNLPTVHVAYLIRSMLVRCPQVLIDAQQQAR